MNRIKLFLFFSICSLLVYSCKSVSNIQTSKTNDIVETAKSYQGTKYKFGGIDKHGIDCSGLVYTSFLKNNIKLPRTSYEQSKQGRNISFNKLTTGDLLFFKNSKSKRIDHVGIVVSRDNQNIRFIHSSSSKGVIISSIEELYWKNTFVKGKRMVNAPTSTKENMIVHKVTSGETLYRISKKYHTTVQAIKKANNLKTDEIYIGMILKIL